MNVGVLEKQKKESLLPFRLVPGRALVPSLVTPRQGSLSIGAVAPLWQAQRVEALLVEMERKRKEEAKARREQEQRMRAEQRAQRATFSCD